MNWWNAHVRPIRLPRKANPPRISCLEAATWNAAVCRRTTFYLLIYLFHKRHHRDSFDVYSTRRPEWLSSCHIHAQTCFHGNRHCTITDHGVLFITSIRTPIVYPQGSRVRSGLTGVYCDASPVTTLFLSFYFQSFQGSQGRAYLFNSVWVSAAGRVWLRISVMTRILNTWPPTSPPSLPLPLQPPRGPDQNIEPGKWPSSKGSIWNRFCMTVKILKHFLPRAKWNKTSYLPC